MIEILDEVEFETRTVGPLVLTTPFLRNLGLAEIVDRLCPVGEQAEMGHGVVAEMVVQCRLTEPRAIYDMVDWAERYDSVALYEELAEEGKLNDDRVGRMLDSIYDQRAVIWGEMVGRASRQYEVDMRRLHADTAPIKFAGLFAQQAEADKGVPRLEPGYNPQGEWVQQLKLFALATGDGGLPIWFDTLSGGEGDSPNYVPQFEAFSQHAQLATMLPLEEIIVLGDRKMPTADNQLAWLRLGVGYIGPTTMQNHHRQTLQELLKQGQGWTELPYVAGREANKKKEERTIYQGVGHTVTWTDPENDDEYPVRHLYIRSSALAQREAKCRADQMKVIEAEIQRIQGLVNKYDYKTPEIIAQRVQKKAFKKRAAQGYFEIKVLEHPDRPQTPLELLYTIDHQQISQDAELDGVYLLVAGGPATALDDACLLQEWKGQYKVEHCFRLTNQLFLVGPLFLKTPRRIASLIFLIMVGSLVAGLIERQIQRALAQRQEPIHGLMPEGRDHLKPTVTRILQVFAHYSLVRIRYSDGSLGKRHFAKLDAVQQQILDLLGLPCPAELFARPAIA
ncbi:MAG: IS1634 family transposase [bacterium]|nr:IS1634 family transposase [bacterium]